MCPMAHRIADAAKVAAVVATVLLVWGPIGAALGAEPATKERAAFRYTKPPAGDPWEFASWRAFALEDTKPQDLVEKAHYRGTTRRYLELPYGSTSARPVLLVVDEQGPNAADLYADRNGDRIIETAERLDGRGNAWRTEWNLVVDNADPPRSVTRALAFRLGRDGRTLQATSIGYCTGTLALGDKTMSVRRVDGDANGRLTDPRDRIWIDFDGNGQWDPFSEQLPFRPILTLADRRFALRGDELGERLLAEPILGAGSVKLDFRPPDENAKILELSVAFVGDDGSAFTFEGAGPHTLPVGRYALTSVVIALADPKDQTPWQFVFSRLDSREPYPWHTVSKDGSLAVDPIGLVQFQLELRDGDAAITPGRTPTIEPRLTTPDGLILRACRVGSSQATFSDTARATIRLARSDGAVVGSADTGLA